MVKYAVAFQHIIDLSDVRLFIFTSDNSSIVVAQKELRDMIDNETYPKVGPNSGLFKDFREFVIVSMTKII